MRGNRIFGDRICGNRFHGNRICGDRFCGNQLIATIFEMNVSYTKWIHRLRLTLLFYVSAALRYQCYSPAFDSDLRPAWSYGDFLFGEVEQMLLLLVALGVSQSPFNDAMRIADLEPCRYMLCLGELTLHIRVGLDSCERTFPLCRHGSIQDYRMRSHRPRMIPNWSKPVDSNCSRFRGRENCCSSP